MTLRAALYALQDVCPHCDAGTVFVEFGDRVCLVCGWRDVGQVLSQAEAQEETDPKPLGQQRRRLPSHGHHQL